MKQFEEVNCSRGAPMGRASSYDYDGTTPVRCFRVNMQGGSCYDDGGAYWGCSGNGVEPLWHCRGGGLFLFTRTGNRVKAKALFEADVRQRMGKTIRWAC